MKRLYPAAIAVAALALLSSTTSAQGGPTAATGDTLFQQIAASDSAFFDAYNNCQLSKMESYFTRDVEFYHDQSGLSRLAGVMDALRKNICGKVRRDPVSLEVYPLKGYGAMASGLHRFCDSRKHQACVEGNSGLARFVTLWRRQNGRWRMARVISYDHH